MAPRTGRTLAQRAARALAAAGLALAAAVPAAGLTLLTPAASLAAGGKVAPADPAFVRFLAQGPSAAQRLGLVPAPVSGDGLGVTQPAPVTLRLPRRYAASGAADALAAAGEGEQDGALEPPPSWDLRDRHKLSLVRDQGRWGTCWAFAALASLESSLLPVDQRDFSENNLVQRSGFELGYDDGGNSYMAAAYLLRWDGPVDEADDPYAPDALSPNTSPQGAAVRGHVHEVLTLPARTSASDNTGIKWAVMTYGAAYATMHWTDAAWRESTAAYCSTGTTGNHAVDVVGWDDSFPASRFAAVPAGPGAFLVRNSWGSGFGADGYFWVSYHDLAFGRQSAVFTGVEPADPAERVYQHDPLGWVTSYRPPNAADPTTAWFAAAYTPAEDGTLTAAGFYAPAPNAAYEIRVAESVAGVRDAAVAASGTLPVAGYHTVALDAPATVKSGARLVIAVRLTTPEYRFPIAVERPYAGYADATAAAGQSFVSGDGSAWSDMTALIAGTDVCLKGYGRVSAEREPAPTTAPSATPTTAPTLTPAPTPTPTPTPETRVAPELTLRDRAAVAGRKTRVIYAVRHPGTATTADVGFTLRTRTGAVVRRRTLHDVTVSAGGSWRLRAPARRGAYVIVAVATLDTGEVSRPATATLRVR